MKIFLSVFLFAGLAKYCSKYDPFSRLDAVSHPDYVHKMEILLATDMNSDDSATSKWATDMMQDFEPSFRNYSPSKSIAMKLRAQSSGIAVKVVGGNWCSDTKRELPRLCKVLYYMGVPADSFMYYRVGEDKKAIEQDFAAIWTKGLVPDIVVYRNGKELGHIKEMPRKTMEEDLLQIVR
jgi:hypothetical protein